MLDKRCVTEFPRPDSGDPQPASSPLAAAAGPSRGAPVAPTPRADAARPQVVADLGAELADLSRSAREAADREARAARFWRRLHLAIGLPTAVLAGAAAVTGLATAAGRIPAAALALVVACLSAASTFLGCEARARAAEQRASAWEVLSRDARIAAFPSGFTDEGDADHHSVVTALHTLTARQGAILRGDLDSAMEIRERTLGIRGRQEPDWELTTPSWGGAATRLPDLGGYLSADIVPGGAADGGGAILGGASGDGVFGGGRGSISRPRDPGGSAPAGPRA